MQPLFRSFALSSIPANLSSAEDTQGHDADTPTSRPAEYRAALALFQVPSRLFKRLRHTGGVMQTHAGYV